MNNNTVAVTLECVGFKEAKQEEVLNYHIPYCRYLYREHNGQHQYVWLVSYDSVFLEAVIEVFLVPRNSRAKYHSDIYEQEKRGYRTLHCCLERNWENILSILDVKYLDAKERKALEEEEERKKKEKEKKNA